MVRGKETWKDGNMEREIWKGKDGEGKREREGGKRIDGNVEE